MRHEKLQKKKKDRHNKNENSRKTLETTIYHDTSAQKSNAPRGGGRRRWRNNKNKNNRDADGGGQGKKQGGSSSFGSKSHSKESQYSGSLPGRKTTAGHDHASTLPYPESLLKGLVNKGAKGKGKHKNSPEAAELDWDLVQFTPGRHGWRIY